MSLAATPKPILVSRPPETLAERFWSLARDMEGASHGDDPVAVVRHVLAVLDALAEGGSGSEVTVNTLSFLHLLRQQEVKGDLLYASPEQARGEQMDERSLVFSVGVLLFEKLTGRHPFGAEGNPRRVARIRRGELASGVNYFPKVPDALRAVLVKAMGPFPEERYGSLAELRARLEAFLDDSRPRAHPRPKSLPALPSPDGRATAEPRRQRASSRSVGAAMVGAATRGREDEVVFAGLEVGTPKTRLRRFAPVVWMAAGALGAAALLLARGGGDSAPAASVSHSARPAEVAPAPTPAVAPVPDPAPAPEPPAPTVFDPDLGGEAAVAAARECFDDARLAHGIGFGASLVYGADDGLSRKIYFGGADELVPAERSCLSKKLVGLAAGAAPEATTVVVYSLWLDAEDARVKHHIQE